jgi:hypothetical protein
MDKSEVICCTEEYNIQNDRRSEADSRVSTQYIGLSLGGLCATQKNCRVTISRERFPRDAVMEPVVMNFGEFDSKQSE